jgi:hypothetical protein
VKIRIGKEYHRVRKSQVGDVSALSQIEATIVKSLTSDMVQQAFRKNVPYLKTIAQEMEDAADDELRKVFEVIAEVIDIPRGGPRSTLTATQLATGMTFARSFRRPTGAVDWSNVTRKYALQKDRRHPTNSNKLFKYSGALADLFGGNSASLAIKKLGLSQVEIVQEDPEQSSRSSKNLGIRRLGIGRVTLRIMPKVSGLMLPMLRSRQWTSGSINFDRAIFKGTKTALKLTGRRDRGTYRPLLTPTLQFFMLVRIPNAIKARLNDKVRRTK